MKKEVVMVKHFCDLCGHELKEDDCGELRFPMGDGGKVVIGKKIMVVREGIQVWGDLCWECAIGLVRINAEVGS